MRVLLDTNAFLRRSAGKGVPSKIETLLRRPTTELILSIITGWEISLKPKLKRTIEDFELGVEGMGAVLLPITLQHVRKFAQLPYHPDHNDPFDRMLIAQALAEDLSVVTSDTRFSDYKGLRVLWD